MRPSTYILPHHLHLRRLDELMLIYEHNYQQLTDLAPDLLSMPDRGVSIIPRGMDLHLLILERARYTTTLELTYYFDNDNLRVPEPNLRLRLYHDAAVAEVMDGSVRQRLRGRRQVVHGLPAEIEDKWRTNRFLERWLGYCLHQGHVFSGKNVARYHMGRSTPELV